LNPKKLAFVVEVSTSFLFRVVCFPILTIPFLFVHQDYLMFEEYFSFLKLL